MTYTEQYEETKNLIARWPDLCGIPEAASDRHVKGRPGIPGTIIELNNRVQHLIELGHHRIAARLIEKKVRKAYRIEGT
jgi:hypothetical protein